MFDSIKNFVGACIGRLELLGLWYPVRCYDSQLDAKVWRGSRLDSDRFKFLSDTGFRSTVDLRLEKPTASTNDAKLAQMYGLKTVNIPVLDNTAPTFDQIVLFLNWVDDLDNVPCLIHCEAGRGRTGCFSAAYRISRMGWTAEEAITEAIRFGIEMPDQIEFIRKYGEFVHGDAT